MNEVSANQDHVSATQNYGSQSVGVRGQRRDHGGTGYQHLWTEASVMVNVGEITTLELIELLHKVADEIQLRMMQTADDGK